MNKISQQLTMKNIHFEKLQDTCELQKSMKKIQPRFGLANYLVLIEHLIGREEKRSLLQENRKEGEVPFPPSLPSNPCARDRSLIQENQNHENLSCFYSQRHAIIHNKLLTQVYKGYVNSSQCFIHVGTETSSITPRLCPRVEWLCLIANLRRWMGSGLLVVSVAHHPLSSH